MSELTDQVPITDAWYKHGWVWFLIAVPSSAVVMGVLMIFLATTTNNSLVVDDYYRQGKAINRDAGRDQMARSMGMNATVIVGEAAAQLQLNRRNSGQRFILPQQLDVRWVHIALADHDGAAVASRAADGQYRFTLAKPIHTGDYRLHIAPSSAAQSPATPDEQGGLSESSVTPGEPTASWRLVSQVVRLGQPTVIRIDADSPGQQSQ